MLGSNDCVSPPLSASPPPAPPPLPPMQRGCPRCRFAASTTNIPIMASRCDLQATPMHGGGDSQQRQNYGLTPNAYTGFDGRNRQQEEDDSAYPALLERELHSLHRNVPALRRAGVDTNAIRQHFYPDGGWGWIVCGVAFLAHVLTTGFQLSYGLLLLYAIRHLGNDEATEAGWLGVGSWAVSLFSSSIVIALCRRKSTRLTAVLGGLVLALGILFTSFATQLHQVAFSFGIVIGIGAAMVRESSTVMLGHYFKRRRQFVEMITMSGEGVGVALFSVILKEGVGKMGWRLGLQAVTGLVSFSFFMGLLYRPASLYHPQRRAILHLKNQRKKVKEKKTHVRTPKPPFLDFSPLKCATVQMLIISASIAAFGVYAPIFYMSLHGYQEGYDMQDLVLVQTFIGLSIAVGIVISGTSLNKLFQVMERKFSISCQYLCQGWVSLVAISTLILSAVTGYRSLCIIAWTYGLGLGGYRYSMKMFTLERVKGKHFTKAWGYIRGAESIPIIIGIPLTVYLNDSSHRYGRAGYYISSAAAAISAILMFFVGYPDGRHAAAAAAAAKIGAGNGSIMSHCTTGPISSDCPDLLNRTFSVGRCGGGTHHGCYHSSPYTTMTNGYSSNHHLRHSGHQYPNGNSGAGGGSSGATGTGCFNNRHSNFGGTGAAGGGGGHGRLQKSLSFAFQTPSMMNEETCNPCQCYNIRYLDRYYSRCDIHQQPYNNVIPNNGLQQQPSRSRSVPEGLAQHHQYQRPQHTGQMCECNWNQRYSHRWPSSTICRNVRPIQVVEQITTSV